LSQLGLGLELLTGRLDVTFEHADFVFSFKEFALVVVFFTCSHTHLVLHVAEVEALFLYLLLCTYEILSLLIELTLQVIEVRVQHRDGLLQVLDLLVLCEEFPLVSLNVIDKDSLFTFSTPLITHRRLELLKKFVFCLVKVLDEGAHSLKLSRKVFVLRLLGC